MTEWYDPDFFLELIDVSSESNALMVLLTCFSMWVDVNSIHRPTIGSKN